MQSMDFGMFMQVTNLRSDINLKRTINMVRQIRIFAKAVTIKEEILPQTVEREVREEAGDPEHSE